MRDADLRDLQKSVGQVSSPSYGGTRMASGSAY